MNLQKFLLAIVLPALLLSCRHKQGGAQNTPSADSAMPTVQTPVVYRAAADTGNHVFFLNGHGSDSAVILVDSLHPGITWYAEIDNATNLHASLVPEHQPANIRFNQIIEPGGKADGPFGQTFSYPVSTKGRYSFRIGPSRMAEGVYSGKVVLLLAVE